MKQHPFTPGVVQVRSDRRFSRCTICGKPGKEITRIRKGYAGLDGNVTRFWQHRTRPAVEPGAQDACDWQGTGRLWCCKALGHTDSHHAHRGPRREVHAG